MQVVQQAQAVVQGLYDRAYELLGWSIDVLPVLSPQKGGCRGLDLDQGDIAVVLGEEIENVSVAVVYGLPADIALGFQREGTGMHCRREKFRAGGEKLLPVLFAVVQPLLIPGLQRLLDLAGDGRGAGCP